jgi:glycerol kinase
VEHILVIDVGTSSLKAIVYDNAGRMLNRAAREYHSEFLADGRVEQDPITWQQALLATLKETGEWLQAGNFGLDAIAVTSQRASIIPVGADGRPLRPAIMWQDKRSRPQCGKLLDRLSLKEIYARTGLRVDPYFSAPKMMWLRDECPEIYAASGKLIGVQDYVIYLLTGRYVTDWTQACRTMLMNIAGFRWDDDMLAATGIARSKLPELCPPGSKVGTLREEIARPAGLASGIPVIVAGGDQQCAALALNVIGPGDAEANTGTGSFVIAYADRPRWEDECRTLCSAAAVAGKWIVEAGIFNTGSVHRWFKEQFYSPPQRTSFAGDPGPGEEDAYALMNREAAESPIGANGVLMLSHFGGSAAPYWNPLAKGVFFNLSLGVRRGDLARAILEGIALEIAHNLSLIEPLVNGISRVSVAGGLVACDLFNQIQADAFAKTVVRYDNHEASSLGALMSAAVELGIYRNHRDAFRAMCPAEPIVFRPDPANAAKYAVLFERKRSLYEVLQGHNVYDVFADPV